MSIVNPYVGRPFRADPPMLLSSASIGLEPARLVSEGAEAGDAIAHIRMTADGSAVRTLLGSAHRHWYEIYPSIRMGAWQPVESEGEHMLAMDSEIEFECDGYQTQAMGVRTILDGEPVEWICDHLRRRRCGTIEAIEVKPDRGAMTARYRRKMLRIGEILGRLGWRMLIRYHDEIRGSQARQDNRALVGGDGNALDDEDHDAVAAFDRLMARCRLTTLGRLSDELSQARFSGRAKAHAMMIRGRVDFPMDESLHRGLPVVLHPARTFDAVLRGRPS